jgi:hypothetical protein
VVSFGNSGQEGDTNSATDLLSAWLSTLHKIGTQCTRGLIVGLGFDSPNVSSGKHDNMLIFSSLGAYFG